jgi:hypothetical protein
MRPPELIPPERDCVLGVPHSHRSFDRGSSGYQGKRSQVGIVLVSWWRRVFVVAPSDLSEFGFLTSSALL